MIGNIYMIKNPKNKIYIGQTINFHNRMKKYKYLKCFSQPKIFNSIKKHGFENHIVNILETIEEEDKITLIEKLNKLEIFYINKYNSTGNFGLNCGFGGKNSACSQETIEKIRNSKIGKKHSQETKLKLSLINSGKPSNRKGCQLSIEHKMALIKSLTGRKSKHRKKVLCSNGIIYDSISHASNTLNIPRSNINSVCNGKRKTANGLKFNYYYE
jgi:group I intron endonuclease